MNTKIFIFSIVLAVILPAEASDPEIKQPIGAELQGLVIDKTLTPPGRQFYREFARMWWELNQELTGNLIIVERPSALRGSQISILLDRRVIWITSLSPAKKTIKKKSIQALGIAERQVKIDGYIRSNSTNPDMGVSEL